MSRAIVVKNGATQAWRNLQMRWRIATLTLLLILILTLTQHITLAFTLAKLILCIV